MNDNHIFGVNTKPSPQLNSTDGCKDFSPLPWDAYFDKKLKIKNSPDSIDTFTVYTAGVNDGKNPIFVFVHGAGHTALSFALTARKLKNFFFCAAFDMRGHGETEVADHQNFELDTLAEDAVKIVQAVSRNGQYVVLVGHSLGGAVAVVIL